MCPRVNVPESIKTADYYWNKEYWDLKEIKGNSKRSVDNKIKYQKNQCANFIIDNSKYLITNNEAIKQIKKIFNDPKRKWIKKMILIENDKLICYFKRK